MLKEALKSRLPLICLRTNDVAHIGSLIDHYITGESELVTSDSPVCRNDKVHFMLSPSEDTDYLKLYRRFVSADATLVVVNPPEYNSLMFDAGEATVPVDLLLSYLEGLLGPSYGFLAPALGGLSLKEAFETVSIAMSYGEITTKSVLRARRSAIQVNKGVDLVDTTVHYYVPSAGLQKWLKVQGAVFTADGIPSYLVPRGMLLSGIPGCLSGDTILNYRRGARPGSRPIKLVDFYKKFNGIKTPNTRWDTTLPTYLHSKTPEGVLQYNRVISVIASGVKPVVRVTLTTGESITLTEDHPIAGVDGVFRPTTELYVGSKILMRGSMLPVPHGGRKLHLRPPRVIVNLKFHPYGAYKLVDSMYEYKRVAKARLVVEAHMNGMPYDEFVHALKHNRNFSDSLKFLPSGYEVHHLDENTLNDDLSNLVVLTKQEHARVHGKTENFNMDYFKEGEVLSIEPAGSEETYDIQMEMPSNNFVANGIVVHNTGKTMAAKHIAGKLKVPLFHLSLGSAMGKYVGESEGNLTKALAAIDNASPCIVLVDEVEKIFSSNDDSGVTSRLLSTLLWWLQEHTSKVLTVMTTNDHTALPAELYREGRVDSHLELGKLPVSKIGPFVGGLLKKISVDLDGGYNLSKVASQVVANLGTGGHTPAEITQATYKIVQQLIADGV